MTPTAILHRLPTASLCAFMLGCAMTSTGASAKPQSVGDIDGDGRDDVVVGVEGKRVGAITGAGAAHAIFGTVNGLRFGDDVLITQDDPDSVDNAEIGEAFGRVVAVGDFDGDGFDDIAIGVPLQDIGAADNAGAVHVFYGAAGGVDLARNEIWSENTTGIEGDADDDDQFGSSLAVGDFNDDGYDDLAIGVPNESLSGLQAEAGVVYVLYGSNDGLDDADSEIWSQNSPSILDVPEDGDEFGTALTTGDFDNDGYDDLVVGVPFESVGTVIRAGGVHVIFGTMLGLTPAGNQFFTQNTTNIDDASETGDFFGFALAAGDFNGDGRDDLAVGVPNENVGTTVAAGAITVMLGSINGLAAAGDRFYTQATPGILENAEVSDYFGFALAAGDFNNDEFDDLVVGVPGESVGAVQNAGSMCVLYGQSIGLEVANSQLWRQGVSGMRDSSENGDNFGQAVATGDLNGDGFDDVIIGVPNEGIAAKARCGAIHVMYGSAARLRANGNQFISQDTQNAEGVAKTNDRFGGQRMNLFN